MFGILRSLASALEGHAPLGDVDHPDAPFLWAVACGEIREARNAFNSKLHPLSFGRDPEAHIPPFGTYSGEDGPRGYTSRDAKIIDRWLNECHSQSADVGGYVVEATDDEQWMRVEGHWERL